MALLKKVLKRAARTVKQAAQRITAWSYSRLNDYRKCPLLAKLKHVDKLREPDNPAMENGTIVHQLGQQYVEGVLGTKVPPEFAKLRAAMQQLRKQPTVKCEQEWAFDSRWRPVDWFAKDAWLRVKVDAHYLQEQRERGRVRTTVCVIDYKTGKEKPEHAEQRSLYAAAAFVMYPDAEQVVAAHWYTETGATTANTYKAAQLGTLQRQWEQRTRAMLADSMFAPRPGSYCRWCHFRKANGGPCKF